jgi:hypothetical protein
VRFVDDYKIKGISGFQNGSPLGSSSEFAMGEKNAGPGERIRV